MQIFYTMSGVLYTAKTRNREIDELLDNPKTGREIVRMLLIERNRTTGQTEEITIDVDGKNRVLRVTELGLKKAR